MSDINIFLIMFFAAIPFVLGILFRQMERNPAGFGFRLIYLFIPTFFVGWYLSDFLFKDWTEK